MYEILVIDDDVQILDIVEVILKREGYRVLRAASAPEAFKLLSTTTPDLFVIDAVLPDVDGVVLCKRLREMSHTATIPIIFLTGQTTPYGVVEALNSGGDDYVRKPFAPRELAARVRALIRRSVQYMEADVPTVRIVPRQFRVFVGDREVSLTRVEFDLLRFLCETPYRLYTAEQLLASVWQYPDGVGDAALVRNHIHNLRRKIENDPERPMILQSRHGRGYVVKARAEIEAESA